MWQVMPLTKDTTVFVDSLDCVITLWSVNAYKGIQTIKEEFDVSF